ncbi:MAG: M48 family metallopeptidase, partial [Verrucomicrobia bacterium]|nr:M48 family metallopeptidase [Verrucomicrobiota bacterium]
MPHAPTSLLYPVGLLLVTTAMVLLPLCYVALILCAGWLTLLWATHFTFLLPTAGGGPVKLVVYCIPLFAGMTAVIFMVKPLFAPRPRRAQPLALNPTVEPLLFAFITSVCGCVGAPRPGRIDVDCHLDAMASLRRGPLSLAGTDLVLTLGVPLVAALDLRQFAGVLAHDHVLDNALPSAYKGLQASWNQARTLPASFPAYLLQV